MSDISQSVTVPVSLLLIIDFSELLEVKVMCSVYFNYCCVWRDSKQLNILIFIESLTITITNAET